MLTATRVRAFGATRAVSSSSSRNVVCAASTGRRDALAAGLVAAGASLLMPRQAWALIPDEEDEEMLERAKANRARRLASQKETTREFLRSEGLADKQLDSELIPVQKAVLQLAKSGSQLEAGDVKGASSTLRGGWVTDFQRATSVLDASEAEKAAAEAIFADINALQATAGKGDLQGSKRQYVALVAALQDWAKSTGLAANLKGL